METKRLAQFCTIVETGSLTRASEIHGITLSGLSRSMKLLQEEIKKEIFKSHGRGILITDEGRSIYNAAKQILPQIRSLSESSQRIIQGSRIGCLEVFSYNLFGSFPSNKEEVFLEIVEKEPGSLELEISKRRLDFGLTFLPFTMEGVEHAPFAKMEVAAFVRKGTPKADGFDAPFIVPVSSLEFNPTDTKSRDGWPEEYGERRMSARVTLLSTAIDLCVSGFGAVYMPTFIASIHNSRTSTEFQLEPLPLPKLRSKSMRDIFLVKRTGDEESKFIKKVVAHVKKTVK